MSINLVPFRTIYGSVYIIVHRTNPYLIPHEIISLLGNFALFMPFGYFIPRLFEKYRVFIKFILFTFVVLLSIETIQVLTIRGCFDVDDIILNLAGAVIGFFIARIAMSWKRSDPRLCSASKQSDRLSHFDNTLYTLHHFLFCLFQQTHRAIR